MPFKVFGNLAWRNCVRKIPEHFFGQRDIEAFPNKASEPRECQFAWERSLFFRPIILIKKCYLHNSYYNSLFSSKVESIFESWKPTDAIRDIDLGGANVTYVQEPRGFRKHQQRVTLLRSSARLRKAFCKCLTFLCGQKDTCVSEHAHDGKLFMRPA